MPRYMSSRTGIKHDKGSWRYEPWQPEFKEQNFQQSNKYNNRHTEFISASPGKIFPCTPRDPKTSSG